MTTLGPAGREASRILGAVGLIVFMGMGAMSWFNEEVRLRLNYAYILTIATY